MLAFFAEQGIKWKTISEKSPWYGGFYERLVSLVKRAIKKSLWKASVSTEELRTWITKIEGVLNTRPLLSLGSDFHDGGI